jgi:hypothetical protein
MIQQSMPVAHGATILADHHNALVDDVGALKIEVEAKAVARIVSQTVTANAWSLLIGAMPTAMGRFPQMAVLNGKAYSFGGYTSSTARAYNYEYDVATGVWTTKTAMPGAYYYNAAAAAGAYVYCVCGLPVNTTFYRYYPAGNSWATMAATPVAVLTNPAAASDGTYVYSTNSTNTNLLRYNIATNTWDQRAAGPWTLAASLAMVHLSGKLYVVGGVAAGVSPTLYIYTVATNTWENSRPWKRDTLSSWGQEGIFVLNGDIYISVSETLPAAAGTVRRTYRYVIASGEWVNDLPLRPVASVESGYFHNGGDAYIVRDTNGNLLRFSAGVAQKATATGIGVAASTSGKHQLENYTTGAIGPAVGINAGDQWGPHANDLVGTVTSVAYGG